MEASEKRSILVIGSGRLVTRVVEELNRRFGLSYDIKHISSESFRENEDTLVQEASIRNAERVLRAHHIDHVVAVVLVDTNDDVNVHLLLSVLKIRDSIPIVATFFHDKIVSNLECHHKNVVIINPAEAASSHIVEMIKKTTESQRRPWPWKRHKPTHRHNRPMGRVARLLVGFVILFLVGSGMFFVTQGTSALQSIYLMVTIITSVNFNDAQLVNATSAIRAAMTVLLGVTYFFVLYALAVVIDEFDKHRTEAAVYGRRRYRLHNHVIVCGLGRVGFALVDRLLAHKIKVLVFEKDPDNRFLRQAKYRGVPVFIGNASFPENLEDAGIMHARALIAAANDDFANLKVALSARSVSPNIRVGLRIFDQEMAEEIRSRFKLHYAFSKSNLVAKDISARLSRILR